MFKILKSKKGFTLVELMIVVVIMAILVAVAVPIFSAVTEKARAKTCASNQREIFAQINNAAMSALTTVSGKVIITTDADDSDKATIDNETGISGIGNFSDLFQELPFCPKAGNSITVEVEPVTTGDTTGGVNIEVYCSDNTHESTE